MAKNTLTTHPGLAGKRWNAACLRHVLRSAVKTLLPCILLIMWPLLASGHEAEYDKLTTAALARYFSQPPMTYRPYVWWHWMGSNFSKEGIRKDLEAMKESGIAGATIFNLSSAVQESHRPVENNPWPGQTYRSDAYWEAIRYAAEQAERLGLKIGLHNTPGYSTTGGPWISERQCMQKVVMTKTDIDGGRRVEVRLPQPDYPVFTDYSGRQRQATFYEDITVMAVPEKGDLAAEDVVEIPSKMDAQGMLTWDAPAGRWHIYRIGHAPTMSTPHPLPDDIIGQTLEADKMNADVTAYHWQQMLGPLKEHVGRYFGRSFTHLLVDSYEAGGQDWTDGFRERFVEMHGYDPLRALAIASTEADNPLSKKFQTDRAATISRMFIDNGWKPTKQLIHEAGLKMFWEPYWGPFSTEESIPIPDLPMSEFWTSGSGRIGESFVDIARDAGKNIVGAEAFTGRPEVSHYTEDPAFLKHSADGTFVSGINLLFLHHWVHQPFDDRYQPGMGMGWWGTHFGRNQTWFRPGKAFMTYLSRCQMMLQQGRLREHQGNQLHRELENADVFFIVNQTDRTSTEEVECAKSGTEPELWDPYTGAITYARDNDCVQAASNMAVSIRLRPGQSMFVVFNRQQVKYRKAPAYHAGRQTCRMLTDVWDVSFQPKVDEPFSIPGFHLTDLSHCREPRLKYFSGTATYSRTIDLDADDLAGGRRVILHLGTLNDIAELTVNGKHVATLWYPPYEADITPCLRRGANCIAVAVTNNWANRLIGDEQYEPDFEWGMDRGEAMGRAIKGFPDWFVKGEPRPSRERKTFVIWSYFRKDSPLQPAGLVGPVEITFQEVAGR